MRTGKGVNSFVGTAAGARKHSPLDEIALAKPQQAGNPAHMKGARSIVRTPSITGVDKKKWSRGSESCLGGRQRITSYQYGGESTGRVRSYWQGGGVHSAMVYAWWRRRAVGGGVGTSVQINVCENQVPKVFYYSNFSVRENAPDSALK